MRPRRKDAAIAIFHYQIQIVSRGKGKSAVGAAAYRSGTLLTNLYDGETHDYTRKEGVIHTEILLPKNAPAAYTKRAVLWNAVEQVEKSKKAQLAREIEVSLPIELTREQQLALARDYVQHNFVDEGMCADLCFHDRNVGNPHFHVILTIRPFEQDGSWGAKQRKEYILDENGQKIYDKKKRQYKCGTVPATDWNEQTKAEEWRASWAAYANAALERYGHPERIDHRSYARQGIEQIPTIHLGAAANQMEKRGIRTERGDINRAINLLNQNLRELRAQTIKLQKWLEEELSNDEQPTLAEVITGILEQRERAGQQSRYAAISSLKDAASVLNFLTENGIQDVAGLDAKVQALLHAQMALRDKFKPVERRLHVLDEHLTRAEQYTTNKPFAKERDTMKPKQRAAYEATHRSQLTLFDSAKTYLDGVMNGKKGLPIKAWKEEREKLTAEKEALYREYDALKGDIAEVERIRKSVREVMREPGKNRQQEKENLL